MQSRNVDYDNEEDPAADWEVTMVRTAAGDVLNPADEVGYAAQVDRQWAAIRRGARPRYIESFLASRCGGALAVFRSRRVRA